MDQGKYKGQTPPFLPENMITKASKRNSLIYPASRIHFSFNICRKRGNEYQ